MSVSSLFPEGGQRPLSLGVLGSGGGSNLRALLNAAEEDPSFSVEAILSDRPCGCQEIAKERGIPHRTATAPTDEAMLDALSLLEERSGLPFDLLFLAGYMRLVKSPLLEAFPNRILNVHPADLAPPRRYVGLGAVRAALEAEEKRTRSSIIVVDESIDGGPLLVSGPWVEYREGFPLTREQIQAHQARQKELSDWPAAVTAVQLVASGKVGIDQRRQLYVGGRPLGNEGWVIKQEQEKCVVFSD